jgi:hypothetical protein
MAFARAALIAKRRLDEVRRTTILPRQNRRRVSMQNILPLAQACKQEIVNGSASVLALEDPVLALAPACEKNSTYRRGRGRKSPDQTLTAEDAKDAEENQIEEKNGVKAGPVQLIHRTGFQLELPLGFLCVDLCGDFRSAVSFAFDCSRASEHA